MGIRNIHHILPASFMSAARHRFSSCATCAHGIGARLADPYTWVNEYSITLYIIIGSMLTAWLMAMYC